MGHCFVEFYALFKEVFDHPAGGRDVGNLLCKIQQGKRSAADALWRLAVVGITPPC